MSNLSNDEFRLWDIFRKIEIKIGIELLEKKTRFKPEILKEWEGLASGFCNSIFYRLTGVWLQDHPCLITPAIYRKSKEYSFINCLRDTILALSKKLIIPLSGNIFTLEFTATIYNVFYYLFTYDIPVLRTLCFTDIYPETLETLGEIFRLDHREFLGELQKNALYRWRKNHGENVCDTVLWKPAGEKSYYHVPRDKLPETLPDHFPNVLHGVDPEFFLKESVCMGNQSTRIKLLIDHTTFGCKKHLLQDNICKVTEKPIRDCARNIIPKSCVTNLSLFVRNYLKKENAGFERCVNKYINENKFSCPFTRDYLKMYYDTFEPFLNEDCICEVMA